MNIAMVTFSFYPDGLGGAHSYVYHLARELIRKGHHVYIITVKMNRDAPDEETIEGMKVFRYRSILSGRLIYIRRFLSEIINVRRVFRNVAQHVRFDIIHYHSVLPAFGINIFFGNRKTPRIYTFHSSSYKDVVVQSRKKKYSFPLLNKLIFLLLRQVEKMTVKAADKIVVLSEFSKQFVLSTYGGCHETITKISGGVDLNQFIPVENKTVVRNKLQLPANKMILLTARRLVERMGLENLILAIPRVAEEIPDILLLILGEGFLKERLQRLIHSEGVDEKVRLMGFVDFKMIASYYQAADIFVLPSELDEWFGLVTLEGLASGIPVLSTPVGGSLEILSDFDKNLLLPGTTPHDIARGIISFVNSTKNLGEYGKRCRQFVNEHYSWEKVAGEMELLYRREINRKH